MGHIEKIIYRITIMNMKNLKLMLVASLFVAGSHLTVANADYRFLLLSGKPGGWSKVELNDAEVIKAAEEAVKAKSIESEKLQLMFVKSAEQQIVAGVNYRLTLRLTRNGRQQDADVLIWWQAWRSPDPYRLLSWHWK